MVTGAAGNLGRRVTAALLGSPGVERVLAVDIVNMPVSATEVEAHAFDLAGPGAADELAALAKGADAILHLAWQPEGEANLTVLQNVLDAATSVEPVQFVHLSSATVYGAWPDNPLPMSEEVVPRPNPELAYAVEKRSAEVMVERWARQHPDVAVALLRPACTVGSPGQPLYQALARAKRPPLGERSRTVQYLHVDDLARAVVHTWQQCLTGTYNVAPDRGVDERLAGALAGGPSAVPLPSAARRHWAEWRWKLWRGGAPPGARAYVEHSWVIAGDKLRATGWRPEYSSEEALVVSDEKSHWDDLPTNRRALAAAAGAVIMAAGAGGALWRQRHRPG